MNVDKVLKFAKGFRGRAKNCKSIARERVDKALQYAYISRKLKKRQFRSLWIQRINASSSQYDMKYSEFIHGCQLANVRLDRKVLSELAVNEPYSFRALTYHVQQVVDSVRGGVAQTIKVLSGSPPVGAGAVAAQMARAKQ
eukprot:TRINITY_DN3504_c0_g1_i4.p1 TRINITY_DN3504_c0_g1~~TRINITY_DN3504_c0_g1_i4.p1  ORF type:complete len:141 (+),score=7.63 TRINITY_DN3504_c0_g1_i4:43-465(+)